MDAVHSSLSEADTADIPSGLTPALSMHDTLVDTSTGTTPSCHAPQRQVCATALMVDLVTNCFTNCTNAGHEVSHNRGLAVKEQSGVHANPSCVQRYWQRRRAQTTLSESLTPAACCLSVMQVCSQQHCSKLMSMAFLPYIRESFQITSEAPRLCHRRCITIDAMLGVVCAGSRREL